MQKVSHFSMDKMASFLAMSPLSVTAKCYGCVVQSTHARDPTMYYIVCYKVKHIYYIELEPVLKKIICTCVIR